MRKGMLSLAAAILAVPAPAASMQSILILKEFFLPDPQMVSVRAGGSAKIEGDCDYGYVSDLDNASVVIEYTTSGSSGLYVYVEGAGDTMLAIDTPDLEVVCDDDSHGSLNPIVYFPNAEEGEYYVFVGSYAANDYQNVTLYISESNPDGASGGTSSASSGMPDLSLEPTYGRVSLTAPFSPDPHTVSISAGGSVDVDISGCSYGYVARAPDYNLTYSGSGSALYFFVRSDEDTTLLINKPDASWICDDDSLGDSNPVVTIPNAGAGLYNIWVGTYSDTDLVPATLYISTKGAK